MPGKMLTHDPKATNVVVTTHMRMKNQFGPARKGRSTSGSLSRSLAAAGMMSR